MLRSVSLYHLSPPRHRPRPGQERPLLPAARCERAERGRGALRLQEHLQERPRLGRVEEALCPEKLIAIMEHSINLCILFSDDINKYCKYFLDEEQYHSGYKRAVKRTHNVYDSSCRNFTASEYIWNWPISKDSYDI